MSRRAWVAADSSPRSRRRLFVNLFAVLVTGLFAGGVSCAAVQGGLLTGLITRQHAGSGRTTTVQVAERSSWRARLGDDLAPVGGFLAGQLLAQAVLGAL